MKKETFQMCLLFDFYGEILTEKQKELFDLYYNEDLSLSEISENLGITRQGARDGIVRAERILQEMERKLSLVRRYGRIDQDIQAISVAAAELHQINMARYRSADIRRLTDTIQTIVNRSEPTQEG